MIPPRMAPRVVLMLAALAGVALCMTVLFLSMRAVMDIGGSCASGGPFEIARPCPEGIGWMVPVSIVAGIAFAGLYVGACLSLGLRGGLAIFFWSALFGSLGWNFIDYALDPPGPDEGIVWGWLIPGIVFWLMAAPPLFLLVPWAAGRLTPASVRVRRRPPDEPSFTIDSDPPPAPPPGEPDDLVGRLERLAALRAEGALDADEYERAKDALLRERR